MANTKTYEELRDLLRHELDALTKKGDITKESLDYFYKLTCTMKNIERLLEAEKGSSEGGYSQRMMPMYPMYGSYEGGGSNRGSYNSYEGGMSNRGSYEGGMSNRGSYDGGMSNRGSYDGRAGRDADNDGRYSEDGGSYSRGRGSYNASRDSSGRYSREGQSSNEYSRHTEKERLIEKLESMMGSVSSEKDRQAIMRCIEQMEG